MRQKQGLGSKGKGHESNHLSGSKGQFNGIRQRIEHEGKGINKNTLLELFIIYQGFSAGA
jgi:hypothetical protein